MLYYMMTKTPSSIKVFYGPIIANPSRQVTMYGWLKISVEGHTGYYAVYRRTRRREGSGGTSPPKNKKNREIIFRGIVV